MIRTLKPAAVIAGALLAGAVALAPASSVAQSRDRLSVAITETISGYNPYSDNVVLVGSLWCKVYGCLMRYDFDTGAAIPFLAESMTAEDDLNWIIKLRPDWKRHNGDAVVAEDVVHSIDRMRNDPQSMQGVFVQMIKSAVVLDDLTVRITTTEPTATLPDYFTLVRVTSKKLFDQYGAQKADREHPHGAGPYKLVEVGIGSHMVLDRVDDHPMIEPTNPKRIVYRIMAEPEQRVTALANGEVQIAQGIPPQLIARVNGMPNARVETANSVEMMFLAMNPSQEPWNIREVRQAVAYAINREAIVRAILGGQATLLNGPIGPGQYGFDPDYKSPFNYDPAKARALLKQAGKEGVAVDFYTPVGRYTADRQVAEAITSMLNDAGFKVNLKTPEWATLWSNVQRGGVPFYYMGRGQMLDPTRALAQYFETDGSPRLNYSNAEVDKLLRAERAEFDPEKRVALLRKAMETITEDAPAAFMWHHKMAWGVAKGVDYKPRQADRVDGWEIHLR